MSHSKTLLDAICELLGVAYEQEFNIGDITYKIVPYRLMKKYPYGYQIENFENILQVVINGGKQE